MATAKKAAKAAETETTKTTKAAEKEEKASAKKAPAKKTAPKKVAPKKVAPKKPAETKVEIYVEYNGTQVSIDKVIEDVKLTNQEDAKELIVYLKPQENKAYFVADGEAKDMDVYF